MGVEKENIIFYGIKEAYDVFIQESDVKFADLNDYKYIVPDSDYSCYRKEYDFRSECAFVHISDGMSGKYSCIGILVSSNGQDRYGEDRDLNDFISPSDFKYLSLAFNQYLIDFNIPWHEFKNKIGLYTLTHYT